MNLKVLVALGLVAVAVGLTSPVSAKTAEECQSMLLASCDCSCINKEEGAGDCVTIQDCLQEAGQKGKVTCNATPSEEFQKCATPPCPTDCAVIFSFQPEAE